MESGQVIDAGYLNKLLEEYMKSPEGQKELQKQGYSSVSKEEIKVMMLELENDLYNAGVNVVKTPGIGGLFYRDSWSLRIVKQKDGNYKAYLTCDPDDLKRNSFSKVEGRSQRTIGYSGSGVYDIVGLFTQGYTASKFASGLWESTGKFSLSHSLGGRPGLAPNSFIDDTINNFKNKHADVISEITYPSLWHSR